MAKQHPKEAGLAFCILMDLIGYISYCFPGGVISDFFWAPLSAFIFYRTFGGLKGAFGGLFNLVEELSPGLDFIPTFTIVWLYKYFRAKTKTVQIIN
jgi:hypothetical protein